MSHSPLSAATGTPPKRCRSSSTTSSSQGTWSASRPRRTPGTRPLNACSRSRGSSGKGCWGPRCASRPLRARALSESRSWALASPFLPAARERRPRAVHGRCARTREARRAHLHRTHLRDRRHHAAQDARAGLSPPRALQRAERGVQGHRDAAPRESLRGQAAEDPGRHLRRYRDRCRVRPAREAGHPCLHALAAQAHDAVPARADVLAAGPQYSHFGGEGRVRRLPGPGEESERRRGVQGAPAHRRGEFDQLGARRGAGGVLLQALLRGLPFGQRAGELRRPDRQLRQHLRRLRRTAHGAAGEAPGARGQREQRAG